jgi:hypothetical protein
MRDIVSGLAVLAFTAWGVPAAVGLVRLVEAAIPGRLVVLVLAGRGSTGSA